MTDRAQWQRVDEFLEDRLLGADESLSSALRAALADSEAAGLPPIAVSPTQGMLLHILARSVGARRILEVGTLGGYSAIWLARALPEGGRLVTVEVNPEHAKVAGANLQRAGLADRVEIRLGRGLDVLTELAATASGPASDPFDLAFIDADKPSNPDYFALAMQMVRPGGLVVVDNVVRNGALADGDADAPDVRGSRAVCEAMGADPRAVATAVQTVGVKGYDGFAIALVTP